MRACTFRTLAFGKGYALTKANEQPLCTGCKSADHDPYNCPFSRLPGWLGFHRTAQATLLEQQTSQTKTSMDTTRDMETRMRAKEDTQAIEAGTTTEGEERDAHNEGEAVHRCYTNT